ncbi:radical SAM protein [Archaeoglobales archaeon ex4484_92]|nr:MAG: radical SAM protein [Archaeoglobales archaeon ex4484_92]
MMDEISSFLNKIRYSKHCIYCEGINESISRPKHHPSYEFTSECNLDCLFCYSRIAKLKGLAPKPGYYGNLKPKVITISQFGEPFSVGEEKVALTIDKLREIFGEVRIDLQTNGTYDLGLMDGRADIILVSLNAASSESFQKITRRDMFNEVIKNIKRASEFCYTIVRSIYMPGLNDHEIRKIAEIGSIADEFFLQPLTIYEENHELLKYVDVGRVESIYEYLSAVYELSENVNVRIPGCLLLNLRQFARNYDLSKIIYIKRNAFGKIPRIKRKWRFVL